MSVEFLSPQQNPPPQSHPAPLHSLSKLDAGQIQILMEQRKALLEELKPSVSRKIYYLMEEKLLREEAKLREILDWQEGKVTRLSRYSLILDPNYFEQEFLN